MKVAVQRGDVELVITHMPDCGCDLTTPDPEATLVQLGCVTGYLVSGLHPQDGEEAEEDSPLVHRVDERDLAAIEYGGDARVACGAVGPGGSYCEREPHNPAELHGYSMRW